MFLPDRLQAAVCLSAALFTAPVLAAPAGTVAGKVFNDTYTNVPPIGDDQICRRYGLASATGLGRF